MVQQTAAVIVTFRPDAGVFHRIKTLADQVDVLYVVDNTPEPLEPSQWPEHVVIERNFNQGGLAGALNIALQKARANDIRYFFVFDQDTEIAPSFCNELLTAALALNNENWAIAGPRHVNSSTGHPVRLSVPARFMNSMWPEENSGVIDCLVLINSCSLLDLHRVPPTLVYDENLAVDMVDVDFCLAVHAAGLKMLCLPSITVSHGIGNRKKGAFAFSATNYNSHRKYLQTRNRLAVWRKYVLVYPSFVLSDGLIWAMDSVRTIFLEPGRWSKFKAILSGIVDGIKLAKQQPKVRRR